MHITVNKLHRVIFISNSEKTFCEINYFLKSLPQGLTTDTAQKMKFSINDFFSKCAQKLRVWSRLLNQSLIENFILCTL